MPNPLRLPCADGTLHSYTPEFRAWLPPPTKPFQSRVAFAAAHVVANPFLEQHPSEPAQLDWDATLAYRRHLLTYGFSLAEAMDTAQRGMGMDWETAKELIRQSAIEARAFGHGIAAGVGTDHLPNTPQTLDRIEAAYLEQAAFVEGVGAGVILMSSRHLAAAAKSPEDFERVYDKVLSQVSKPVILHWLGDAFDTQLAGYWGTNNLDQAMQTCLGVIQNHASKIDGIKLSLLDKQREIELRRLLPNGVRMYTGDDFNYPELILGDTSHHSHALLGIFDAIAPVASQALCALDQADIKTYHALLEPTVELSRHIFQTPTYKYKTGVVFLAYLNGFQNHFRMVGGLESARSIVHLGQIYKLADLAGLIRLPDLAMRRIKLTLALAGIE